MVSIVDWYIDGYSDKVNHISFLSNSITCNLTISAFYLLSFLFASYHYSFVSYHYSQNESISYLFLHLISYHFSIISYHYSVI